MVTTEIVRMAPVCARYQVTLPRDVRERLPLKKGGTDAYIQPRDEKGYLVITLKKPEGTYNPIRISHKGQWVIPKNIRKSQDIEEGTNLKFTTIDNCDIEVRKTSKKEQKTIQNWNFFLDVLDYTNKYELKASDQAIQIERKNGLDKGESLDLLDEMEKITNTKLMMERTDKGIKLVKRKR
jgi:AbrB family looped-hinge helix DNA binding protein